ncbi:MAG TPA: hypothetical protein VFS62_13705 [Chloroflexota bacterium]|nr:hypothetical protein [Chloroflexota bacterium]
MDRPSISLDMDGVICTPFLGKNIAISRRLGLSPLPADVREHAAVDSRRAYERLRRRYESIRYMGRKPLPDIRAGLAALSQVRSLVLVTGRSWRAHHLIDRWLQRYDLARYFDRVLPNNTDVGGPHYKLWTAQRLGHAEHVDDDGSVAYFLAGHGIRVFLRDWPRNRGLPYPRGVTVYRHLEEVAAAVS